MNVLFSLMAGVAIGVFFYFGLWLTVQRMFTTRHPVVLTVASFWGRTIIALAAFLLVANGRWENALASLAGFALGRVATAWLTPKGGQPRCT
ncbi:MAG TPA: ATP synthase subunit I [Bryobacteraceae bacterium]|nr:ATP synthase subunit I [Bryobacteraceae bacterium]